ncbi:MAG: DNA mismatch repair endonuclease MutL [Bacteroidetes bacterium]|nr:DNA mismatch repair endonuclease MutL [Bacteroidota bacterium]
MADVIQLLSDHLANQIAAGEVIQRPASAVKELLENAIDAGATDIQLVIKDAGKEWIQVIDNGKGMSVTDARMSFERHATSKIKNIEDLFRIRTMGFRGEALASIAAVAQVELKSRQKDNDTGTRIVIEATEVKLQEPCATAEGTNIIIKNLFFNVPARRHFLKSNTTELRHVVDEFTRVTLAHPQIAFRMWHNGTEQFHLPAGNLKTRIVDLLGGSCEKNLVPVGEKTEFLNINGFIGKPLGATRTRGLQFFFINNRFIRNAYLNHALVAAYEGLIDKDAFPFYVLFLETDPARVDVNVHPTKQEVKFEDDKMMYAYLNAAVKHALARNNISPSLDFTLNKEITQLSAITKPIEGNTVTQVQRGYLANAFSQKNQAHFIDRNDGLKQWKELYAIAQQPIQSAPQTKANTQSALHDSQQNQLSTGQGSLLVQGSLLISTVKSGLIVIHIRRAQERIWYERLLEQWNSGNTPSQQMLFPATYEFPPHDALLLEQLLPDLSRVGFDIVPFGNYTFVVQGVPTDLPSGEEKNVLDEVIDQIKHEAKDAVGQRSDKLLMQMARRLSINKHSIQQPETQQALIDELFACSQPEFSPTGKQIFTFLRKESLDEMLG